MEGVGVMFDAGSYAMGLKGYHKGDVVISSNATYTDDGAGNIIITDSEESE